MKKIVSVLLVLVLTLLMLSGCKKNEEFPESTSTVSPAPSSSNEAPESDPEPEDDTRPSISITNFDYTVAGADLVTDKDETVLRIYIDVTNTSDDILPVSDAFVFDAFAYQNGTELKNSYTNIDKIEEYDNIRKSIFPGVTIRRVTNYHLLDESDVHYFLGEYKAVTGLELDFDITNLPELGPKPEIIPIPTLEPASTIAGYKGEKAEFSYSGNNFELEIVKYEVVENKGEKCLRVYFNFTLLELRDPEKLTSPAVCSNYYFYQDGIMIGSYMPTDVSGLPKIEGTVDSSDNIDVGESSYFSVSRTLNSDSDVLVRAATGTIKPGAPFIGAVFSVK